MSKKLKITQPREIRFHNKIIAIFFPKNLEVDKLKFFTPGNNNMQVGLHLRPKGEILPAHIHRIPKNVKINSIQELLYVQKGKIKVILYSKKGVKIKEVIMGKDDSILLIGEGHGVEVLSKAKIFEIKQGPYFGAKHAKVYYKIQ